MPNIEVSKFFLSWKGPESCPINGNRFYTKNKNRLDAKVVKNHKGTSKLVQNTFNFRYKYIAAQVWKTWAVSFKLRVKVTRKDISILLYLYGEGVEQTLGLTRGCKNDSVVLSCRGMNRISMYEHKVRTAAITRSWPIALWTLNNKIKVCRHH